MRSSVRHPGTESLATRPKQSVEHSFRCWAPWMAGGLKALILAGWGWRLGRLRAKSQNRPQALGHFG